MKDNSVLIAVIGSLAAILGAFGAKEVTLSIIGWWKEQREERKKTKALKYQEITDMKVRLERMEKELDKHRQFEVQTISTLNSMIPLMKEIMKDHPDYVKLLEQLERNIIGGKPEVNVTPEL